MSVTTFRRLLLVALLCAYAALLLIAPLPAQGQAERLQPAVLAEAINQANVRSGPGVEYPLVAEISAGTRYSVVGRSAFYPWLLLALSDTQQGWVFSDLMRVIGNLNNVPFTEITFDLAPTALPTLPSAGKVATTEAASPLTAVTPTTAPENTVLVEIQGELNVRFGPGVDYPRLGIVQAGDRFMITRRHTQVEWVEIAYPGGPNGRGWVYLPAVKVIGDLNVVPTTSTFDFGSPALTATPPMVRTSTAPWLTATATPHASADADLVSVSNTIYDLMLSRRFDPATSRQGSAFLLDLNTGQNVTINPGVAYSGMSLIKIPVMTAFYRKLDLLPTAAEARTVAEMMVCSENLSSNAVLRTVGDGDPYRGAESVTETMRALGLKNTFLVGPFFVGNAPGQPTATVVPVSSLKTEVDQQATEPDPFNQATPADLGWLLSGIYQCAMDEGGPLMTTFPGEFTVNECRQMVRLMRANRVAALIGAGIPADVPLARKYGWVDEVHGDAALITSPGADYVLVVMLRNKTWLNYEEGFPLIAEASRLTYNHFNPAAPLAQTNAVAVPTCSADTIEPELFTDLRSSNLPPIR